MIDLNQYFSTSINSISNNLNQILKTQQEIITSRKINRLRFLLAQTTLANNFVLNLNDTLNSSDLNNTQTIQDKFNFHQQTSHFLSMKTGVKIIQIGGFDFQLGCSVTQNSNVEKSTASFYRLYQEPLWQSLLNYHAASSYYRELKQWNQGINYERKSYGSCEIISLDYAQAMTRSDRQSGLKYNMGSHYPMIVEKNLHNPTYINYLKKISNPIAVKINCNTSIECIIQIIAQLDPFHIPGRLTLIPCFGVNQVSLLLPQFIEAVGKTHPGILWSCDPLLGNIETTTLGTKTANLANVIMEIEHSFLIHKSLGSKLNGLHLRATHQKVNECLDYDFNDQYGDLSASSGHVDPRLNFAQTIHVLQYVAKHLGNKL